jgi:flagellar basal body-associated protein FliL
MTDEEKGDFVKMEDPKMAESKGSNLKLILVIVGILLIIGAIAIILLIRFNKDSPETKEEKKLIIGMIHIKKQMILFLN